MAWILGNVSFSRKCSGFLELFQILGTGLDSGKCIRVLGNLSDSGNCFCIIRIVLISGKCDFLLSHRKIFMKDIFLAALL